MNAQLSVSGKTFIVGEYLVLQGGPALLLSNNPRFILEVSKEPNTEKDLFETINPQSPAGKLLKIHWEFYKNYAINFIDPYQNIGGLGASGAQFVLIYALKMQSRQFSKDDLMQLLETYQTLAWDGVGIAPSGADLISQVTGEICFFHRNQQLIKKLSWPFSSLDYCLIHTGNKIATHEHLRSLAMTDFANLEDSVNHAVLSFEKKDTLLFADCIQEYGKILQEKKLVLDKTTQLLELIRAKKEVLAAKGCGTLSADIIFVLLKRDHSKVFANWCREQKLRIIYLGHELGDGFLCSEARPA